MRNIAQAKEEIIHTVQAYTAKDEKETIRFRWSASAPCCLWDRRASVRPLL